MLNIIDLKKLIYLGGKKDDNFKNYYFYYEKVKIFIVFHNNNKNKLTATQLRFERYDFESKKFFSFITVDLYIKTEKYFNYFIKYCENLEFKYLDEYKTIEYEFLSILRKEKIKKILK